MEVRCLREGDKTVEGWLAQIVNWINQLIWGFPALLLILGAGLYFTCRLGFLPIRRLPMALGNLGRRLRQPPEDGVSPFQAVCTALAATVGTGNIAGVAGAIALGGPGAVFWMWIAALLGMSLKYAEAVLAVRYRQPRPNGQFAGGPMYYMEQGLGKTWRPLAVAYCCFGVAAAFGVGNSTQVSAAVTSMNQALAAFQIPETFAGNLTMGLILGLLVGLVVLGGAKRIGSVAEYLIPVVCLGYVLLGVGALIHNRQALPQALASIVAGAFSPRAVTGGAIGSLLITLRIGVARGVFTNEAGMGTASIAHAGANVRHPAEQGLYGIFEVFADTLVICTMTALVILTSGVPVPYGQDAGAELTVAAFASVYGSGAAVFLAIAMALLAFATILGWGLYGSRCAEYLLGGRGGKLFAIVHAATTVLGALVAPSLLWNLAEALNGLMAVPNLIALLALSPEVIRLSRAYFSRTQIERRHAGLSGEQDDENLRQRQLL